MISLEAEYDCVLRVETYIVTKTSKTPQSLEMVFDTGAGSTVISEQLALDLFNPFNREQRFGSLFIADSDIKI
jgi:hypothetical protein